MDSHGQMPFRLLQIPSAFHSDGQGEPFTCCLQCDADLTRPDALYVIEKAIRRFPRFGTQDTVFEYAMCWDCQLRLYEEMSLKSRAAIETYFQEHLDVEKRILKYSLVTDSDVSSMIEQCAITGTAVHDLERYQLVALCRGGQMLAGHTPLMISEAVAEALDGLISNETRDIIDGFVGDYLGVPPEFNLTLRPRPVFL